MTDADDRADSNRTRELVRSAEGGPRGVRGRARQQAVPRAPAHELAVQARRVRHRRDDGSRQGFPRAARRARGSLAARNRQDAGRLATARASGCCRAATDRPSRRCTSRRKTAARCASPRRSAACSTARSARRRSRASIAISPPPRSSARCGSRTGSSGWKVGDDRIITNIVLMGMGEPLANFRNVIPAIRIFLDDLGFDISRRRVTLSHLRPRAADLQARRGSELRARGLAARAERRAAQPARADQPQAQHRRAARSLLALPRRTERPQRHLRIRDARRRERPAASTRASWRGCCATSPRSSTSSRSIPFPEPTIAARRTRRSRRSAMSSSSVG